MSEGDKGRERKLATRVYNKRIDLLVSALNAVGLGIFGAAFIAPAIREGQMSILASFANWSWIVIGVGLHLFAQVFVGLMRSED